MKTVLSDADGAITYYEWNEGVGVLAQKCHACGVSKIGKGEHAKFYYNTFATFDIETTKLTNELWNKKQPEMMHYFNHTFCWSVWCEDCFIFGRAIDDFFQMLSALRQFIGETILVWYVHNLAFEFNNNIDFFYKCEWVEGFWRNATTPLFIRLKSYEFRCSAQLTHKSLRQIGNEIGLQKLEDFDYDRKLGIYDELSGNDVDYSMRDVKILWLFLDAECTRYCDKLNKTKNIAYLPLTQTGYVRNDIKKNFSRTNSGKRLLKNTALSREMYQTIRPAFYGGDVHANFRCIGIEQRFDAEHQGMHVDLKSAYPWAICTKDFCLNYSEWCYGCDEYLLKEWLKNPETGIIAELNLYDVMIKPRHIPYIPYDPQNVKSVQLNTVDDNGKVVCADAITITLCDTDIRLILDTYEIGSIEVKRIFTGVKKPLPYSIVSTVVDYFNRKTTLKDVKTGDPEKDAYIEYLYSLSKQMLNGIYGLFATQLENRTFYVDPVTFEIKAGELEYEQAKILPYQIALQVTAYVREAIAGFCSFLAKHSDCEFWYCDTDSIFCKKNWRTEMYVELWNEERRKESERLSLLYWNIIPKTPKGKDQVLGSFDIEEDFNGATSFCTIGSKRYYIGYADGTYQVTFSGLRGTKRKFNKKLNRWENGRNTQRLVDMFGSMQKAFQAIKTDGVLLPYEEGVDKLGHYNVQANFVSHELGYKVQRPCSYTLYPQDLNLNLNLSLKWFLQSKTYSEIMEGETA